MQKLPTVYSATYVDIEAECLVVQRRSSASSQNLTIPMNVTFLLRSLI